MAQLLVRTLDDDVKRRICELAAKRGHSMEQEIRNILEAAVAIEDFTQEPLGTRIARRFAGLGFREDENLPKIHGMPQPADFVA